MQNPSGGQPATSYHQQTVWLFRILMSSLVPQTYYSKSGFLINACCVSGTMLSIQVFISCHLSTHLSIHVSTHLPIHPFIHLIIYHPLIHSGIHPPNPQSYIQLLIHPFTHPSSQCTLLSIPVYRLYSGYCKHSKEIKK